MSEFAWPLLAAALAAGAMYWLCIRPMRRGHTGCRPAEREQLAALRTELAELRAGAGHHHAAQQDNAGHTDKEFPQ